MHRSAGIRALYLLGHALEDRGNDVGLEIYDLEFADRFGDEEPGTPLAVMGWHNPDAIHIVSEGIANPPAEKSVRWLLGPPIHHNSDEFYQVDWFGVHGPRLCIDVIEREFFYQKSEPGDGLLTYGGKYGRLGNSELEMDNDIWPKEITHEWPATREELGNVLRAAGGLISYDPNSMLNLEATICGTPVLMVRGMPPSSFFPTLGIMQSPDDESFERATEEAKRAADAYEEVRGLIEKDVDRFIDLCAERWD